jgi:superoxide dismutase, Fe-Mn family
MTHYKLPDLPYADNALEPHISAETLKYHHGKHHASYVDKLNKQLEDSDFESATLEEIIRHANGDLFNNGAQVWNHSFYWNCLSPEGGGKPQSELAGAIDDDFVNFESFKAEFKKAATSNFGSGWTWLVLTPPGRLEIVNTDDADNPLRGGRQPLLACDVWEHAYYIDYRNARPDYIEAFWKLVNWDFVAANFLSSDSANDLFAGDTDLARSA